MIRLSDEYIRDLQPETLRYDVTLDDDFVISVLPNGIKTWAYLYEYEGRTRRKTLGVYPHMSHEQAKSALRNARNMIERLGGEVDATGTHEVLTIEAPPHATAPISEGARPAVLAPGLRRPAAAEKSGAKHPFLRFLVWPLLAAVGVAAAYLYSTLDVSQRTTTPGTPPPADAPALQTIESNPFATPGQEPDQKPDTGDASEETPDPPADKAPDDPAPDNGGSTAVDQRPPDTTSNAAPAASTGSAPVAQSEGRVSNSVAGQPPPSPAGARTRVVVPAKATAVGGTVPRALMTSRVVNFEPVDDLGSGVALSENNLKAMFFFTELREFSDGQVIHRWELNDRLIADVPLRVKKSWRWRTYSNKDLLPGTVGDWRVSVIDARGDVLATRSFTVDR